MTDTPTRESVRFPEIRPGMVLAGRYRILSRVGKGGMGYVFAAEEESLGIRRMVAIKVLPPQLMMDTGLLARFREEIKIASGLDHPNIVPIYSLGEHQGLYFYVMKLLDGKTAHQLMRERGPFAETDLRQAMAPIARALHYAHRKGVIHRDVKSNNIHISIDDHPTLMDFGIARGAEASELTMPGQVVGTAEYMSPEQWYGDVDPRSDIYSLGIVMFELATGQLPFRSKHTFELMKLHQEEPAPSPRLFVPQISVELEAIILRCLAKDPSARYITASELAEKLESPFTPADTDLPPAAAPPEPIDEITAGHTMIQAAPAAELSRADRRAWDLANRADKAYQDGDLNRAVSLARKATKFNAENPLVRQKLTKYAKLKELTDQILLRAENAMEDAEPRRALADYENVLRCVPMAKVEMRRQEAQRRIDQADDWVKQAKLLRASGKHEKVIDLVVKAQELNREVDVPPELLSLPKRHKPPKRRKKKRPPIVTKGRVAIVVLLAIVAGVVFGTRPAVLWWADRSFAQVDNAHWFAEPLNAYQFYNLAKTLGLHDERIDQNLDRIRIVAKQHYVNWANEALDNDRLGAAIGYLDKALEYDPGDMKLRDLAELLRAKYAVKRSLGT